MKLCDGASSPPICCGAHLPGGKVSWKSAVHRRQKQLGDPCRPLTAGVDKRGRRFHGALGIVKRQLFVDTRSQSPAYPTLRFNYQT